MGKFFLKLTDEQFGPDARRLLQCFPKYIGFPDRTLDALAGDAGTAVTAKLTVLGGIGIIPVEAGRDEVLD